MPTISITKLDHAFQHALNRHQENDLDGAKHAYRHILNEHPNHIETLHALSILLSQLGEYPEALKHATTLIKQSRRPEYLNTLGHIAKKMGDDTAASHHYQAALQLNPQYYVSMNSLGCLQMPHDLEEASRYFHNALQIAPNYPDALYNAALCAMQRNKLDQAKTLLSRYLIQHPNHPAALFQMSQVHFLQKQDEQALTLINRAIAVEADQLDYYFHKATILARLERTDEAIESFERCIILDPDHQDSHHNVAALYAAKHEPLRALPHYLYMAQKAPTPQIYHDLAVSYMHQDRHQDAMQYFHEALRLDPKHLATHINLGAMMLKGQQKEKAIEHYQAAMAIDPNNPEYAFIIDALSNKATPTSPPDEYIQHLFDAYAGHYDQHLLDVLKYRVHDEILQAIHETHGDQAEFDTILDIGCGTGICGTVLRPLCKRLVGVDMSPTMIKKAQSKNIYDVLSASNAMNYLQLEQSFDCIVAADVIPYMGALNDFMDLCNQRLNPGGLLLFTAEKTQHPEYELQDSLRYAHHEDYIKYLAEQNQLDCLHQKSIIARKQNNQDVHCHLWVFSKS